MINYRHPSGCGLIGKLPTLCFLGCRIIGERNARCQSQIVIVYDNFTLNKRHLSATMSGFRASPHSGENLERILLIIKIDARQSFVYRSFNTRVSPAFDHFLRSCSRSAPPHSSRADRHVRVPSFLPIGLGILKRMQHWRACRWFGPLALARKGISCRVSKNGKL